MLRFTASSVLMYQEKLSYGSPMIHLGVWKKWQSDQQFHPARKNRLNMELDKFRDIVLPKLNEIFANKAKEGK